MINASKRALFWIRKYTWKFEINVAVTRVVTCAELINYSTASILK